MVPFVLSWWLLMVAVFGAVAVARGREGEHGLTPSERAFAANAPTSSVSADLHIGPEAAE
jgi:hypothetical protein